MFKRIFPLTWVSPGHVGIIFMASLAICLLGIRTDAPASSAKQTRFDTPEAAVAALVQAAENNNTKRLTRILGPGSKDLVLSGDEVQDRQHREKFAKSYREKHRLEMISGRSYKLFIGKDDWPFAFPIVKGKQYWRFDTSAGKEEILSRRIGRNELSAIQTCLAISDAQRDYADLMAEMHGQPEYTQKFKSSTGKKDGLYWETSPSEKSSPLGSLVAQARAEGYSEAIGRSQPYHGYLYKILTEQGESAEGGALSYIINGKMTGGFAVVAFPASYGISGMNTFVVNYTGIVYRKDLGKVTAKIALEMTAFNPDATWKKVD